MSKVTIVTIAKNDAAGLDKTLASVFAQKAADFESVVIDGASEDGTPEVLRVWAAMGARVVSEPDSGIYEAMNKGIRLATGAYLLFLNSGDVFASETVLADLGGELDGTPIVTCRVLRRDRPGGFISKRRYDCITILPAFIPHQATFIRRSLFERFGLYDESYRLISDWIFFYRTMYKAKIPYRVVDFPVAIMDENGLSARRPDLIACERRRFYRAEVSLPVRALFALKEAFRKALPETAWNALRSALRVEKW